MARCSSVELKQYRSLGPDEGPVVLEGRGAPLLKFRGIVGRDTIAFDTATFRVLRNQSSGSTSQIAFEGVVGSDTLALDYAIDPDSFLVHIDGRVRGPLAQQGFILMDYAPTLGSYEADSIDDQRHLGFAYEVANRGSKGTAFGKLDPGEQVLVPGPLTWVALKNKYFILGVLARDSVSPMAEIRMTGWRARSRKPRRWRTAQRSFNRARDALRSTFTLARSNRRACRRSAATSRIRILTAASCNRWCSRSPVSC